MSLVTILSVFFISLCSIPLFGSWNLFFGIELIDRDIQDIYIGTFNGSPNKTVIINDKLVMIKFGYNPISGYYLSNPLLLYSLPLSKKSRV